MIFNLSATFEDIEIEQLLGMQWFSNSSLLQFNVTLSFAFWKLKVETANSREQQIWNVSEAILFERMILSQINEILDPLGLATEFNLQAKELLRQLRIEKEEK